jgi:hypothetical protein
MDNKVLKSLNQILLGLVIGLICSNWTFSQDLEVKKNDSVKCKIYFTDGFENDTISMKINDQLVFENITLKSNMYYGLTGVEVLITVNNFAMLVVSDSHREEEVVAKNLLTNTSKSDIIQLTIDYKGNLYKHDVDICKNNYIVVYRKWCNLFFSNFIKQPGFE